MDFVGLNLSDEDFHEIGGGGGCSRNNRKNHRELSYQPKNCFKEWYANDDVHQEDPPNLDRLIFLSDLKYAQKLYNEADIIYRRINDIIGAKNNALKRDVLESLTRTQLHLNKWKEAEIYALQLLKSINKLNTDQLTTSFDLLSDVYFANPDCSKESLLANICSLEHHPFNAYLWLKTSKIYKRMNILDKSKACLYRSETLLRCVNKTVGSFVKISNDEEIRIIKNQLTDQDREKYKESMTRDIYHRNYQNDENKEFVDIGSSKFKIEYPDVSSNQASFPQNKLDEIIEQFECKWFIT